MACGKTIGWILTVHVNKVDSSPGSTRNVLQSESYNYRRGADSESAEEKKKRLEVKRKSRRRALDKFDEVRREASKAKRRKPAKQAAAAAPLYGDRGYDSKKNRKICASFGLRDRIFRRKTKTTSRTNAKRIIVENTFSWLDKHRRLLFLYEQHSDIHRSFLLIALGNRVGARFLDADMRASVCTSA
jgi:hypothetical protein